MEKGFGSLKSDNVNLHTLNVANNRANLISITMHVTVGGYLMLKLPMHVFLLK